MATCVFLDDLDPMGREASAIEDVGQDLYHRLITRQGTILDDPDFGLDVRLWLSDDVPPSAATMVEEELAKDARVLSVSAKVARPSPDAIEIRADVELSAAAFTLVATVTSTTTTGAIL